MPTATLLTFTSVSFVTGPATGLYLAPFGSLRTAAAPGARPGTIFTTAQVLLALSKSAGLPLAKPLWMPFAVNTSGTGRGEKMREGQGLTVTVRLPAPGPATLKDLASCASSTGYEKETVMLAASTVKQARAVWHKHSIRKWA